MADTGKYTIRHLSDWAEVNNKVNKYFQMGETDPLNVTVKRNKKTRSLEQNAYMWGVVLEQATFYYTQNVGDLIRDVCTAVNIDFDADFTHKLMKMMFNGNKSTTGLDTADMEEYLSKIREHFYHQYGVEIPLPNEEEPNDTDAN